MQPFALTLLDSASEQGQRVLQPDGSSGICLGCDELHAPAQLLETSEDSKIGGVDKGASSAENEETSPAA